MDKRKREIDKWKKLIKSRHLLQSDLVAPITILFYLILLVNRILFLLRVVTQKLNFLPPLQLGVASCVSSQYMQVGVLCVKSKTSP